MQPASILESALYVTDLDAAEAFYGGTLGLDLISKAEGRLVELSSVDPSPMARAWAERWNKDPRQVELVLRESAEVVRMATGDEIGRIALFLATDDSSFLTGQAIEAEGGACLDY